MSNYNLPDISGEYRFNYNLSSLTWFKVGGPATILFKPKDLEDLCHFLQNYKGNLPIHVLGAGSNTIIRDGGFDGIIIKLGRNFTNIEILENSRLLVGAGALNFNVANFCCENSIKNLEFLVGIPGTIGGGIAMNAGSYGQEFKDILLEVKAVDLSGQIQVLECKDFGFGYRKNSLNEQLIFIEAIFKAQSGIREEIKQSMNQITSERQKTQPINQKTGGSTFANPDNAKAWKLIDAQGLRGHKIGGAQISPLHCNFLVNTGDALSKDLEELGNLALQKVFENTGIELVWEIKIIGKK